MGTISNWIAGKPGAVIAAAVAVLAGLSGLAALPALDRNESAFVQATVQMLESGDFTAVRYQDYWRGGASPGAHWLQAAIVELISSPEARAIWAYRLASLLSLAVAAAATAWGATGVFGRREGLVAGIGLPLALIVTVAGGVATADAPFLAACAVMLAGFARAYRSAREGVHPRRRDRALFWVGLIAGVLIKGPVILVMAGIAGALLAIADKGAPWLKTLRWGWGLVALVAATGPWAVAVTIATDGAYWSSVSRPPQPPSPPLWQTWLSPLFLFPLTALLPLAAVHAWRERASPGVRVAVAWLLAAWAVVEIMPFKQVFGPLPLYIAIAWLGAAGLTSAGVGRGPRIAGAGLAILAGAVLAGLAVLVSTRFGAGADLLTGITAAGLFLAAGLAAALATLRPFNAKALFVTAVLALTAPGWLLSASLPNLDRLWPTRRILRALADNDLDPRRGLAVGPVATAGYAEPSLVFALGASTETGDGAMAALAIADGRPAAVEASEEEAFRAGLATSGASADPIGQVRAYDYAGGRDIVVTVYRPRPGAE